MYVVKVNATFFIEFTFIKTYNTRRWGNITHMPISHDLLFLSFQTTPTQLSLKYYSLVY